MKILIAGDFVVTKDYLIDNINQEVVDMFQSSDYNIVNLEAPITTSQSKIVKTGPHLKADKESTLSVLKTLNIDLVTLANNHVLDYDEQGVLDTLEFCEENSIATVGAGNNIKEALQVFYLDTPKGVIGIINIAENEWASATETTAGANGMDLINDVKQIQEAKTKADFVFVIVHGGHEYYNLPSPRIQKQYRFYAEQGADMIIGHHTHCISGYEEHNGVPIYYSLGNFLFTNESIHEDWYKGLVLEIKIKDSKIESYLHPITQYKKNFKLELLKATEKDKILNRVLDYNNIIKDDIKLKESWRSFIEKRTKSYLMNWSPLAFINNYYIRAGLNKLNLSFLNKRGLSRYLNYMRCEAHLDVSKEVIKKYLKK